MILLSTFITLFVIFQCQYVQSANSLSATTTTALPSDDSGDEPPYYLTPTGTDIPPGPTGNANTQNKVGTHLYGYTDCKKIFGGGAKGKIDGAYYDAWVISNTAGVASNIDWNNAAALEFLGAPGLNKDKQPQIQAVLANVGTVIYSNKNLVYTHALKVRCDDPLKKCQNKPDDDKCQPKPPEDDAKPSPTPIAYATNSDPKDTGYPMINFCQSFFDRRSLADAITYGKSLKSPNNLRLSNYDNRAQSFYHELLHLDLAADSPRPNPRITDLQIDIKIGNLGRTLTETAYGPLLTKILARWQGSSVPGAGSTGYYVQRNADNLAYYALAKYVTSKIGNIYPHLPVVTYELSGPPYPPPPNSVAEFVTEGNNFFLNTTYDVKDFQNAWSLSLEGDYPGCSDNANPDSVTTADPAITINGFAPASAYPDSYNRQVSSWLSDLKSSSSPTPSASAIPTSSPKCDMNTVSDIPYNVFSGTTGNVFSTFCDQISKAQKTKLTWNVDSSGKQKPAVRRRYHKRTPPSNRDSYKMYNIELDWIPTDGIGTCNSKCNDAYKRIALSSCGHTGGQQNHMATSGSVDVGCGTYSYKIKGPDVPAPTGPKQEPNYLKPNPTQNTLT